MAKRDTSPDALAAEIADKLQHHWTPMRDDTIGVVAALIRREREACARLASTYRRGFGGECNRCGLIPGEDNEGIAREIRARNRKPR